MVFFLFLPTFHFKAHNTLTFEHFYFTYSCPGRAGGLGDLVAATAYETSAVS